MTSPCLPRMRVPVGVPLSALVALMSLVPCRFGSVECDAAGSFATYTPCAAMVHPALGAGQGGRANTIPSADIGPGAAPTVMAKSAWDGRADLTHRRRRGGEHRLLRVRIGVLTVLPSPREKITGRPACGSSRQAGDAAGEAH